MSSKDFNLSRDEFRNISRCLDNGEFRDLFAEYCAELHNNRDQYEEELAQLEAQRGYDVQFLRPTPGYVIKTIVDGKQKGFINVCQCEQVQKPSCVPHRLEDGTKGLTWTMPYAQCSPRRDYDNKRVECVVYDVMYHPDALGLAERNGELRQLLNDTALDAVEKSFSVTLDRVNLRFPKLKYKGTPNSTVVRKKMPNFANLPKDELFDKLLPPIPSPAPSPAQDSASRKKKSKRNKAKNKENIIRPPATGVVEESAPPSHTTPEYKIVQRREVEYEEMTNELDAKIALTIPRELKVIITLPLLTAASDCALDVTKETLQLVSEKPAKYRLELKLPYDVRMDEGTAKFNVDERTLTVTLPVLRKRNITLQDINRVNAAETVNEASIPSEQTPNESTAGKLMEEINTVPACAVHEPAAPQPSVVEAVRKTIFPKFAVNKMENQFAFTLNVRNVDPATIVLESRGDSVHCRFSNLGNGFFPCYYVFFVRFPNALMTDVQHEEWDNNLIIQVTLSSATVSSYQAGPSEHETVEYSIMEDIGDKINKFGNHIEDDSLCIAVVRQDKRAKAEAGGLLSIEITKKEPDQQQDGENVGLEADPVHEPPSGTSVDEGDEREQDTEQSRAVLTAKKNAHRKNKARSLSESFCDQLKVIVENEPAPGACVGDQPTKQATVVSPGSAGGSPASKAIDAKTRKVRSMSECAESESMPSLGRKYKGILKRSSFDRSISECSSVDDLGTSVEMSLAGSMGEVCRKTVRFNSAIRQQKFRSDMSILEMKKKSEKKKALKRRSAARRVSEGESTDNDEKDVHHHDADNCLSSDQHDEKDATENDSGVSFDSESGDKHIAVLKTAGKNRKNNDNNKNQKPACLKCGPGQRQASSMKNHEFKSDMIFDIEM